MFNLLPKKPDSLLQQLFFIFSPKQTDAMRTHLVFAALSLYQLSSTAQTPYFQQEVNYTIRATLNDTAHTLQAHVRIEYTNHSPHPLTEIWMHLWPNAYQNRRTAFCRQRLHQRKTDFYFAPDSMLGYISQLNFQINQQPIAWKYHPQHPDIALLTLPEPLPPGGRMVIETPYFLKIPHTFSRLGHEGQSYQISQWYPKPAVYDAKGWHPMPYLEVGEFYSEFGSFDVELTLPANYVVGATGVLQTPEEQAFLEQKITETEAFLAQLLPPADKPARKSPNATGAFPPSSPEMKTIRFKAEKVHDFAWFADKRYRVLREVATLPSGRQVVCWAMFTDAQAHWWKRAAFFIRRTLSFYSENIGEYPWPQATAVEGALNAGGGMEYPMITVIAEVSSEKTLDQVIAHEVGHNWFYGILATNERDCGWMDEGVNTYYESRYMKTYYGQEDSALPSVGRWLLPESDISLDNLAILTLARVGADIPPHSPIEAFSELNYFAQVYGKPSLFLRWVEQAAGRPLLDRAMQHYYKEWQFRHPYPDDLRAAWKAVGLEADWFFEAMNTRSAFDMALRKVRRQADGSYALRVKNSGSLSAPFSISAVDKSGRILQTQWYPAVQHSGVVRFPEVEAHALVLDAEKHTFDLYRSNNTRRTKGLLSGMPPLQVQPVALFERSNRTVVGASPWVAWNNYDKTMLGIALYSPLFPPQRWRYYLLPGVGMGSGNALGLADVQYRFLPGGLVPHATLGLNVRSATYDQRPDDPKYRLRYLRWSSMLHLDFRRPTPAFSHGLTLRAIFLQKEEPLFSNFGEFTGKNWPSAQIYEMRYYAKNYAMVNPYQVSMALEGQQYSVQGQSASYVRTSVEWLQEFYYRPKRHITARVFGGYFLHNTQRHRGSVATNSLNNDVARASFALAPQGFNDYRFDQLFLGRTETSGFLARQVSQTEGGFKNALGLPYAQVFGNSNDFILALNLRADLPFGSPIKPYFDIGYFRDATPLGTNRPFNEQLAWSGGLALEILGGNMEMYFPIVNSDLLNQLYSSATRNYWQRISWSVRIKPIRTQDLERLIN